MTKFDDTNMSSLEELASFLEDIDKGLDKLSEGLQEVRLILLDLALEDESYVSIRAEEALTKVKAMQAILEVE